LSRVRASLVNRDTLADVARRLELSGAIRLGEGELKSGGNERPSILADALEAIYGAVFLDGGFEAARGVIDRTFAEVLGNADPSALGKDPKTRLQEWLQGRRLPVPAYRIVTVDGEAHAQTFTAECAIASLGIATLGQGTSRRVAEQVAAEAAWRTVTANSARA
jgi:ribonuclease-3